MRGYYWIGIIHAKRTVNVGTLWRSAYAMGAAGIFTIGRRYSTQSSDTTATPRHVPLLHFDDLDDLIAHLPYDCPLVGVELDDRSTPLHEFRHPERACYLLGGEDVGLNQQEREKCHSLVEIAGPTWCLNVAVAGSILMYDRMRQFNRATRIAALGARVEA